MKLVVMAIGIMFFARQNHYRVRDADITPSVVHTCSQDSILLQKKISQAFVLLQQYAKSSRVIDTKLATAIKSYARIEFGTVHIDSAGLHFFINPKTKKTDFLICLHDIPINAVVSHPTQTFIFSDLKKHILSVVSEFVQKNSVPVIASAFLHELSHTKIYPEDGKTEIELRSYINQVHFLVFIYTDAEKEYQYADRKDVSIPIPERDSSEYNFYTKKIDSLQWLIYKKK